MAALGTANDLFNKAIALEQAAETFYRRLAKMFAHEADVAKFWTQLADEERGHASFLNQVRGKLPADVLSQPGNPLMLDKAQKGLSVSVDEILKRVQNLDDAYKISNELEHGETNAVFNFILVNFPAPDFVKAQAFLDVQLNKHVSAIEQEFPKRFRTRVARLAVLPRSDERPAENHLGTG